MALSLIYWDRFPSVSLIVHLVLLANSSSEAEESGIAEMSLVSELCLPCTLPLSMESRQETGRGGRLGTSAAYCWVPRAVVCSPLVQPTGGQ